MEGTVKWYDLKKNYGFIKGDDGNEYFVHSTAVPQGVTLRENDRVTFDGVDSQRGKQAQNIKMLDGDAPAEESHEAAEEPAEEAHEEASEEPAAEEASEEEPKEE